MIFLAALTILTSPKPVIAARGDLQSKEFGYGAWIETNTPQLEIIVQQAAILKLDWLAVDFDWSSRWPDPADQPRINDLDLLMELATNYRMPVMLSIRHAPAWARSADGPDPEQTGWFIANLVLRYPETLQAIEIFPGANLSAEWGAPANPAQYLAVLKAVNLALQPTGLKPLIITGGLAPDTTSRQGDMDSLSFLKAMYALDAHPLLSTISVQYPGVQGKPLDTPSIGGPPVLRYYEEIRQVMVTHQHYDGKIWITRLAFMTGKNLTNDVSLIPDGEFPEWLQQAFRQTRSQLYIGAGFLVSLTAPQQQKPEGRTVVLSNPGEQPDSFIKILRALIVKSKNSSQHLPDFTEPQKRHLTKYHASDP